MSSTAGNIQGWKMYNHNAMGDSEVASFVGRDIMERAHAHCISVYGPAHSQPKPAMGRMEPLGLAGTNRGKGAY